MNICEVFLEFLCIKVDMIQVCLSNGFNTWVNTVFKGGCNPSNSFCSTRLSYSLLEVSFSLIKLGSDLAWSILLICSNQIFPMLLVNHHFIAWFKHFSHTKIETIFLTVIDQEHFSDKSIWTDNIEETSMESEYSRVNFTW